MTSQVKVPAPARGYGRRTDERRRLPAHRRDPPARLAPPPAPEPARPGAGGGRLDAASELHRDRALAAERRHGAPPRRPARRPAARAQPAAARRRVRARLRPRDLDAPEMGPVREAIEQVLRGHEPYPAVVVDRHWGLVASNRAVGALTAGVAEHLLDPPVNVLRLSLHPDGMAPRILNLAEWRAHLLERLGREAVVTGDPALAALHAEIAGYPHPIPAPVRAGADIAVPLRIRAGGTELTLISTVTTFGTATDVTVAEL